MENQIQQLEAFQRSFLGVSFVFVVHIHCWLWCSLVCYKKRPVCCVVENQIQQLEAFQRSFLGVSWNLYLFDVIQIV
jgi:hypothetical protein